MIGLSGRVGWQYIVGEGKGGHVGAEVRERKKRHSLGLIKMFWVLP